MRYSLDFQGCVNTSFSWYTFSPPVKVSATIFRHNSSVVYLKISVLAHHADGCGIVPFCAVLICIVHTLFALSDVDAFSSVFALSARVHFL